MTYDVVIIGAGPGGSTTAKFAALGGAKVLLIEKRQEIGSPVRCAEGLPKINFDEISVPAAGNPLRSPKRVGGIGPKGPFSSSIYFPCMIALSNNSTDFLADDVTRSSPAVQALWLLRRIQMYIRI